MLTEFKPHMTALTDVMRAHLITHWSIPCSHRSPSHPSSHKHSLGPTHLPCTQCIIHTAMKQREIFYSLLCMY